MSQQNNLPIISGVDKTPRGEVGAASIQNIIMCCGFFRTGLPSHSSIPDSCYENRELLSLIIIGWLVIIESQGPPTCYYIVNDVGLWQKNSNILIYSAKADFPFHRRVWPSPRNHSQPDIPDAFATRRTGSWEKVTTPSTSSQITRRCLSRDRLPVYQIPRCQ